MYALLIVVCPFVLFPLAIVLSVPLRYTDYDCPFGIFKLFFVLGLCEIYVSYIIPVKLFQKRLSAYLMKVISETTFSVSDEGYIGNIIINTIGIFKLFSLFNVMIKCLELLDL
jgi:hypothetical protein